MARYDGEVGSLTSVDLRRWRSCRLVVVWCMLERGANGHLLEVGDRKFGFVESGPAENKQGVVYFPMKCPASPTERP